MGVFDNISDPSTSTAVPGGNVAKPLVIGLLSVLASRYMSGASKDTPASANPNTGAISEPDASPGELIGGLGGLLKQFQQNGFGDAINSWIGTGQNKSVAPNQISDALGQDTIDALCQCMGSRRSRSWSFYRRFFRTRWTSLRPKDVCRPGRRFRV